MKEFAERYEKILQYLKTLSGERQHLTRSAMSTCSC